MLNKSYIVEWGNDYNFHGIQSALCGKPIEGMGRVGFDPKQFIGFFKCQMKFDYKKRMEDTELLK